MYCSKLTQLLCMVADKLKLSSPISRDEMPHFLNGVDIYRGNILGWKFTSWCVCWVASKRPKSENMPNLGYIYIYHHSGWLRDDSLDLNISVAEFTTWDNHNIVEATPNCLFRLWNTFNCSKYCVQSMFNISKPIT